MLTDDGETLSELELSGLNLSPKRKELLKSIISSYGMELNDSNSICIASDRENIVFHKHMLLQCLTKVQDMFLLKDSNVKSLFYDDVSVFLDKNDIRYSPNVTFIGKSKLPSQFDFVIPKSKSSPERVIKTVNRLDTQNAKLLIFNWEDTREARIFHSSIESKLYAFVNDTKHDIKESTMASISEYGIVPVKWSEKEAILDQLVS